MRAPKRVQVRSTRMQLFSASEGGAQSVNLGLQQILTYPQVLPGSARRRCDGLHRRYFGPGNFQHREGREERRDYHTSVRSVKWCHQVRRFVMLSIAALTLDGRLATRCPSKPPSSLDPQMPRLLYARQSNTETDRPFMCRGQMLASERE